MDKERDIYVGDFEALVDSFINVKSMLSVVINSINDTSTCRLSADNMAEVRPVLLKVSQTRAFP